MAIAGIDIFPAQFSINGHLEYGFRIFSHFRLFAAAGTGINIGARAFRYIGLGVGFGL